MYPFEAGSCHITVGSSGTGKTCFIYELLKNKDVMFRDQPPIKIRYYYGIYQDLFDEMKREIPGISFQEGLPTEEELLEFCDPPNHVLILIDDLMSNASKSDLVEKIFTRISHHKNCSCFYILQNAFVQGKHQVTINLNAKYLEIFRSPRSLMQLSYLNNQIFPNKPNLLIDAYNDVMKNHKYGYVIVDVTPHCPDDLRVRTRIFPKEKTIIFKAS